MAKRKGKGKSPQEQAFESHKLQIAKAEKLIKKGYSGVFVSAVFSLIVALTALKSPLMLSIALIALVATWIFTEVQQSRSSKAKKAIVATMDNLKSIGSSGMLKKSIRTYLETNYPKLVA